MGFQLGAGLEGFRSYLDTEAEANVKIRTDEDAEGSTDAPATVEEVEVNAAEDEKATDDVASANDEVAQTMKFNNRLMHELEVVDHIRTNLQYHQLDRASLSYLDINFGLVSKTHGSVEAFDLSNQSHVAALKHGLEGAAARLWWRIKDGAQRLWETIKKFFSRVYKWILDKIEALGKAANRFIRAMKVRFGGKIHYTRDVEVYTYQDCMKIVNEIKKINFNELERKIDSIGTDRWGNDKDITQGLIVMPQTGQKVMLATSEWTDPKKVVEFARASSSFSDVPKKVEKIKQKFETSIKKIADSIKANASANDDKAAAATSTSEPLNEEATKKMEALKEGQRLFADFNMRFIKPLMQVIAQGGKVLNIAYYSMEKQKRKANERDKGVAAAKKKADEANSKSKDEGVASPDFGRVDA